MVAEGNGGGKERGMVAIARSFMGQQKFVQRSKDNRAAKSNQRRRTQDSNSGSRGKHIKKVRETSNAERTMPQCDQARDIAFAGRTRLVGEDARESTKNGGEKSRRK